MKPKKSENDSPEILTTLYVGRKDIVAVDDFMFDLLQAQGHIAPKKLREVPETQAEILDLLELTKRK
jgi:hypothetical protein